MDMMNESCSRFLAELASKAPTPGGGGTAALVGAAGVALGNMVGCLTVGKKKYAAVEADLLTLNERAGALRAELEALVQFVRFAAGTAYPRVAASFLRRSAEREMHRRGLPLPAQSLLLRHNVSACVFDEDIVWQLQELIAARRGAVITMGRGSVECLPIALRIDMRLGRWYVERTAQ